MSDTQTSDKAMLGQGIVVLLLLLIGLVVRLEHLSDAISRLIHEPNIVLFSFASLSALLSFIWAAYVSKQVVRGQKHISTPKDLWWLLALLLPLLVAVLGKQLLRPDTVEYQFGEHITELVYASNLVGIAMLIVWKWHQARAAK